MRPSFPSVPEVQGVLAAASRPHRRHGDDDGLGRATKEPPDGHRHECGLAGRGGGCKPARVLAKQAPAPQPQARQEKGDSPKSGGIATWVDSARASLRQAPPKGARTKPAAGKGMGEGAPFPAGAAVCPSRGSP